jgi:hypothetical protein
MRRPPAEQKPSNSHSGDPIEKCESPHLAQQVDQNRCRDNHEERKRETEQNGSRDYRPCGRRLKTVH